jgi:tRNA (uracil-5-)-methyltransferase TRM9
MGQYNRKVIISKIGCMYIKNLIYVQSLILLYIYIITMDIEQEFVLDVYDNIAEHFSDTRYCIWDFVKNFLDKQVSSQKGIEIGCGNGKHLCTRDDLDIIGIDSCEKFVDICTKKNIRVFQQNCCKLIFTNNLFDYALSIAVFHHLSTDMRRYKALKEMIRILKPGGKGIVSVWACNQDDRNNNMKKRLFVPGDNYVPWMRKKDKKIFKRYYYIFTENMFRTFIDQFTEKIIVHTIYNERCNWIVEFTKK